jgi:two-component system chemotaxis sensor kinase CheA
MENDEQAINMFVNEVRETLSSISNILYDLEKDPANVSNLEGIKQAINTLKGMFAVREFNIISNTCQSAESTLEKLIESGFIDSDSLDIFNSFNEKLNSVTSFITTLNLNQFSLEENKKIEEMKEFDFSVINRDFRGISEGAIKLGKTYELVIKINESKTKIDNAKQILDSLEHYAKILKSSPTRTQIAKEELFDFLTAEILSYEDEQAISKNISEMKGVSDVSIKVKDTRRKDTPQTGDISLTAPSYQTVRVSLPYLDELMDLLGELVIEKNILNRTISKSSLSLTSLAKSDRNLFDLQDLILKTRLISLEQIFNYYPRLIREESKFGEKKIDLVISGKNIEIDRMNIDIINETLIHLIRNAVAHGIESPRDRKGKKKPEEGKIIVKATKDAQDIIITVEDDGKGIDMELLRKKGIERGLIDKNKKLEGKVLLQLLFHKGFSTQEEVSQLSGRGIGLDIVNTNIVSKLKGKIDVETKEDKGTIFTMRFALNFLIVNALVVKAAKSLFSIPFPNIKKILSLNEGDLINENNEMFYDYPIFQFNDIEPFVTTVKERVPVISLQENYKLKTTTNGNFSREKGIIVIWEQEDMKLGILIDKIVTEQQIVYKPIDRLIENIKGFSGYSFVGDGEMVPILDPLQFRGVN